MFKKNSNKTKNSISSNKVLPSFDRNTACFLQEDGYYLKISINESKRKQLWNIK